MRSLAIYRDVDMKWRAAVNGVGERPWFVCRDAPVGDTVSMRYHRSRRGDIVRYKTRQGAVRVAKRLNQEEP